MTKTLKIATRNSPLALWQANYVKDKLEALYPELVITLVKITTKGDQMLSSSLSKIGGKGLFIKELEVGMLEGRADIAVHSMKDIPYQIPLEFKLGAMLKRDNPFDAFVSNSFKSIDSLSKHAKIGTCSMRRIAQLKAIRPDLNFVPLRGNINTRLQQLDKCRYDGIILACAGLIRLGFAKRITQQMSMDEILPAVGQGALGIEIRANDASIQELIKPLIDTNTLYTVNAERAMNVRLEGGCSAPVAGFATLNKNQISLTGLVASVDSGRILKHTVCGDVTNFQQLGTMLADELIKLGAKELLIG